MATSSTRSTRSQSASASNAGVTDAYSRTSCTRRSGLVGCGTRTHATRPALPMSIAHTRATTCTGSSLLSSTGDAPSPSRQQGGRPRERSG